MVTQIFRVSDMHCPNCAMQLEALEDELPGIQSIKASYARGRLEVTFDEGQLNIDQIIAAVSQKGYKVDSK